MYARDAVAAVNINDIDAMTDEIGAVQANQLQFNRSFRLEVVCEQFLRPGICWTTGCVVKTAWGIVERSPMGITAGQERGRGRVVDFDVLTGFCGCADDAVLVV